MRWGLCEVESGVGVWREQFVLYIKISPSFISLYAHISLLYSLHPQHGHWSRRV